MTNTAKLKAVIIEKGFIHEQIARMIGISKTSFSYKLNNKSEFRASEIKKISDFLQLTSADVLAIFFA